ncbi:hypothetical protein JJL45_09495 [Tamlana sp. s12]|uniref:hypothetical protein n=1 Tax=Tamlana sp. s12 TaxID=1630406 RepID=UPI0008019D04|nr:hypothetical protein [Tamlana sp. s12]OBQ52815.1 hypothetical protein VQ01_12750 [Tamlana sp. s12]QQY81162.1 hypothetical protein JJL45_09495 [Tamlana sp. s12]
MKNLLQFALILLLATTAGYAQKLKVKEGSFKSLKDIKEYTLVFDYAGVEIPKYDSEEEFLEDKMAKREEKEAGAGEVFKKSWFADRENVYEPKFIESFNKRFEDGEVKVTKETTASHTMVIKTTLMYAGYNVGVMRQNAKIEALISIYENSAPDKILFSGMYTKVEGQGAMGFDYNSGYRISEGYAKLAKEFAKDLKKKGLK